MTSSKTFALLALVLLLGVLAAAPARAQFDAEHNHLAAFTIRSRGGAFTRQQIIIDTRFGQTTTTVVRPMYLLVPAKKTGGPGPDPIPTTPVRAFDCYRVRGGFAPNAVVQLVDQFSSGPVTVRALKLLCAPAVVGTTTTTAPPTTTTSTSSTSSTSTSSSSTSSSSTSTSSSSSSTTSTSTTATSLITLPTLPTTLPIPTTLPTLP